MTNGEPIREPMNYTVTYTREGNGGFLSRIHSADLETAMSHFRRLEADPKCRNIRLTEPRLIAYAKSEV